MKYSNPYSIGLTSEELEEFLIYQYNVISSLYFTYSSVELVKIIEEAWDEWVKKHKPELHAMIVGEEQ